MDKAAPGSPTVLDDWKSLRDQQAQGHPLALVKDAKKKKDAAKAGDDGINIWEEKGERVTWSEQLNKEGKREISCASLNRLVEFLTSDKEYVAFLAPFSLLWLLSCLRVLMASSAGTIWISSRRL